MAGIYIHVPFCKTKCIYCAFYSKPILSNKKEYINALCREIEMRKNYLEGEKIHTLYFGGGTPSLLTINELDAITTILNKHFQLSDVKEFTIEANPDDITTEYLSDLKKVGVNRISFGTQSFDDAELKTLNRRHTAQQAISSIKKAQDIGFENISIDLMYGLPNQSAEKWHANLTTALSLHVQHISAYCLTYEEGTLLTKLKDKGKFAEADEELCEAMFNDLRHTLCDNGFTHYEISNFARKGFESKHNSSYWDGTPYVGFGPAAHSYNKATRQWNISDTNKYIQAIAEGANDYFEIETLTVQDMYEDMLLTSLRTNKGLDLKRIETELTTEYQQLIKKNAEPLIKNGLLKLNNNHLTITEKGLFISDYIIAHLI